MKTWIKQNWLAILAIVMLAGLFVPLFSAAVVLPYAYYQLTNWVVTGAALLIAWRAKKQDYVRAMWIFALVAVIFNPIAPIYFSASAWQSADIVAIILFLISFFLKREKKN